MKKWEGPIRKAIDQLHQRSSGDYESLLKQIDKKRRQVQLNLPQMVTAKAQHPYLFLEWGRGTGKTTTIGHRYTQLLQQMPRSTGLFIGPTYQAILTRIIPSLIQGLEMFGIYENLHYFIGREPPRSWRSSWGRAFQPPKRYDKYITFWNGLGTHLISHDVAGDGRGLNTDWILGDEAALLVQSKLQENTDPTLRGTRVDQFKKQPLFGSRMYCSSTPLTPEGQWFVQYEEKAKLDPTTIAFISATCEHNLHNLREGYLEEAERNAYLKWVYLAEYKNQRPNFTKDSFYGLLDPSIHQYEAFDYGHYMQVGQSQDCRGDNDLVKGLPLIVGVDWGAAINCLTVNQYLRSLNEHRALKDMYVLGADQKFQDDLFEDFARYYQYHDTKAVELWYDNTGNNKTGNTKRTRAEQARDLLHKHGWKVQLMTSGHTNPMHEHKHQLWKRSSKRITPSTQLPDEQIQLPQPYTSA